MTSTERTNLAHYRAVPVQHDLDSFWTNTGSLLQNQYIHRNLRMDVMQHLPDAPEQASKSHGRSRTNTMTSSMSFYQNSTPESSIRSASRPVSRHLRDENMLLSPEKKASGTKGLLSKGSRMLRRQGSKFNILFSLNSEPQGSETQSVNSDPSDVIDKHHVRKSSAADLKRDELKRVISEPFDFKHVTHTNRGHFKDLDRVNDKNELISEFSALRAGQRARPELQGIRVGNLPSAKTSPDICGDRSDTPPTTTVRPTIPLTPPRPQPPPKDATKSSLSPGNIHLSRSYDNFSRPVARSPISPNSPVSLLTPTNCQCSLNQSGSSISTTSINPSASVENANGTDPFLNIVHALDTTSHQKPLPSLPPIHAVSTSDDTARLLRTIPLPRAPVDLADVPEEAEVKSILIDGHRPRPPSKHVSLRHAQSFPAARKDHSRHSSSSKTKGENAVPNIEIPTASAQPQALNDETDITIVDPKRVSVVRALEVQDWEDAIDYSWDHENETDPILDWTKASISISAPNLMALNTENQSDQRPELLSPVIAKAFDELALFAARRGSDETETGEIATPDTGLLMNSPKPLHLPTLASETRQLSAPVSSGELSPLFGLGIEAPHIVGSENNEGSWHLEDLGDIGRKANTSHDSAGSGISKSSSEESIIFSIASSIMATQRSSNSSVSLSDFAPSIICLKHSWTESLLETPQEECFDKIMAGLSGKTEGRAVSSSNGPATPIMSSRDTTIPSPNLLNQYRQSLLPNSVGHERAESLTNTTTGRDELQTPTPEHPFSNSVPSGPCSLSTRAHSKAKSTSQLSPTHSRTVSGSRIPIPVRTSSIAGTADTRRTQDSRHNRSATGTSTSRPRHAARASYSLFPGLTPRLAT